MLLTSRTQQTMDDGLGQFMRRYAKVVAALSKLLGVQFVDGSPVMETPLGEAVHAIMSLHHARQFDTRDRELDRLHLFAKHLNEIRKSYPAMLQDFQNRFQRAGGSDEVHTLRFEVNIAASLSRKSIHFTRGESPDFMVSEPPIGIECTSARLRATLRKADYMHKLASAMRGKAAKVYSKPNVLLAMDVTNILHHQPTIALSRKDVGKLVRATIPSGRYGAVLTFFVISSVTRNSFESNYIRSDLPWIDPNLRGFLDNVYPFGRVELGDFYVPYES